MSARIDIGRAPLIAAIVSGLALGAWVLSPPAVAQGPNLEGSWRGGGTIKFPSGDTESATCRASFSKNGGQSFGMNAVCATASVRVRQYAEVTRITDNRYRGEFRNPEYGLSGSIRIVVNGSSLDATVHGGGGSAQFTLNR